MRPGVGGHEMLGLYGEAIGQMPKNPGIAALFRKIFNNAYLPYCDPVTLRAFLCELIERLKPCPRLKPGAHTAKPLRGSLGWQALR